MEDITTETQIIIINYLHEDALCRIFSHLDDIDLKSASLVCKLFCSLSSPLVHGLTLKHSSLTYLHFERLFKRFSGAKKICIHKFYYLDSVLSAICNSDLNLEKLRLVVCRSPGTNDLYPMHQTIEKMSISRVIKGIKSLDLKLFDTQKPQTITKFVNMLSSLTELDFSFCFYQWDDEGIHEVTSKLPNLRKINLSYNYNPLLTDKTLDILSSNCPKLESVNFKKCNKFTAEALYKFFCNNPQLSSVDMPHLLNSKVVECVQVLKNLNHLSLDVDQLEDTDFAGPRPLLKSLVIQIVPHSNYTMTGLSQLLSACPGLESLHIDLLHLENCNTDDAELSIVVKRLPNLKHITVCSPFICQATLLSLVENCPLLETISLRRYGCGRQIKQVYCEQGITIPTKKNHNIKSIQISPKSDIWLLSSIESYCPNLRKLYELVMTRHDTSM